MFITSHFFNHTRGAKLKTKGVANVCVNMELENEYRKVNKGKR